MKYIIIGAMDGVSFDNIFDKLTMDDVALFVEPIPHQFEKLSKNVDRLPCEVFLENCVISDKVEEVEMAYVPDEKIPQEDLILGGCSSVVKFGTPLNRYLAELNQLWYHKSKSKTFDILCEKYGFDEVDYVQIDCEGYDQVIVDSIDIAKYKIKTLKFETHYITNEFLTYFENKTKPTKITRLEADILYEYTY
jgi:FkbM family methyltransferase